MKRVIFAGTPDFAVPPLAALVEGPEQVVAVLTQPDRPAGRGRALAASVVKQYALAQGLPVLQPESLKGAEIQAQLRALQADLMVVVAYGLLLPQALLDIPRLGAINVHASLLPKYRGAAPIQRALAAGDSETGVTIMQMERGLDSGPILLTRRMPIRADDSGGSLHDRLSVLGAAALREALDRLWAGELAATPQQHDQASYAHKLHKAEALLDWRRPALELERLIRAFNPYPVAQTTFRGQALRIWQARLLADAVAGRPGEILRVDKQCWLACGEGALALQQVQMAGKAVMPIADFVNGFQPRLGEVLGA